MQIILSHIPIPRSNPLLFFVFAEKPSSVEIVDKTNALQKDKLVTVRLQTHSTF